MELVYTQNIYVDTLETFFFFKKKINMLSASSPYIQLGRLSLSIETLNLLVSHFLQSMQSLLS